METVKQTVPLEIVIEHYAAAIVRGETAGQYSEYNRVVALLKKHGHYAAVLTLQQHERKASPWNFQKVI
jgi:hypothetical protein